jgi:molybdate transport system permease protein
MQLRRNYSGFRRYVSLFHPKTCLVMLLMLPLSLPPLVAGVALLLFFARTPIGTGLEDISITVVYPQLGIIMAQWFVNLPYLIRVMRSSFAMISLRY